MKLSVTGMFNRFVIKHMEMGMVFNQGKADVLQCRKRTFDNRSVSYYVAFAMYVGWEWLNRTTLWDLDTSIVASYAEKVVQASVILLLASCFFRQRASAQEWLTAIGISILGFMVWRTAAEGWLFWLALFVVSAKDVKIKPLAIIVVALVGGISVFAVSASAMGYIENVMTVRADGTIRMAMGFAHPNSFGASVLAICMGMIALVGRRGQWIISLVCLLGAALCIKYADSRTSAACLAFMAVSLPLYQLLTRNGNFRYGASCLMLLLLFLVVVSTYFMLYFDPQRALDSLLNELLSGRLRLSHMYYLDHSPSLLGYAYANGTAYRVGDKTLTFVVDNLYVHILLRYGVIAWVIFLGSLFILFFKMARERYSGAIVYGMAIFLIYGMSETLGCRIEFNFYAIALWTILYHKPISEFDDTNKPIAGVKAQRDSFEDELTFRDFVTFVFSRMRSHHG